MEGRAKERTLTGMFLKYMVIFCVNTVLIVVGAYMVLVLLAATGQVLPANYSEQWLNDHTEDIHMAEDVGEIPFPAGCEYGVYTEEGKWLYGTLDQKSRSQVWKCYQKKDMSSQEGYYRFILRSEQEVCIVKYHLRMRYTIEPLNHMLPNMELLLPLVMLLAFVLQLVLLARRFAKTLRVRLEQLNEVTRKISENDLEFEVGVSDVKEMNNVLCSLGHMKEALQASLKRQWDLESEHKRKMQALVHDIKTPLTIIKGNAELAEEDLEALREEAFHLEHGQVLQSVGESQRQIVEYTKEVEKYLDKMRLLLNDQESAEQEICISSEKLQGQLKILAEQMVSAKHMPLMVWCCKSDTVIQVNLEQLKRAWRNVLSNALEYTDIEQGIDIKMTESMKEGIPYLCAKVRDYGHGFTKEDLEFAVEEFYRGDKSRHDRNHQGLGLAIVKRFIEAQGGFLELGNSKEIEGAEVTLWVRGENGGKR